MTPEDHMRLMARVSALELVVALALKGYFANAKSSAESEKGSLESLRKTIAELTIPDLPPAMSDHFSAEMLDAYEGFLKTYKALNFIVGP